MLPLGTIRPYKKKHTLWSVLLVSAVFMTGALFMAIYRHPPARETAAVQDSSLHPAERSDIPITLPDSIRFGLPDGWPTTPIIPSEKELWAGKLLLIDGDHAVPVKVPPPNTLSIATEGEGRIAVRTLKHNTDLEVIAALKELFSMGQNAGVNSWLVWEGTRSNGQQLELQLERLKQYAQTMTLVEAAAKASSEVPAPGFSEHQMPFVVDIRLADGWNAMPDGALLNTSPDGRLLLERAWQYGFILRYGTSLAPPYEDEAYHFRYVGVAHSTVMRALQLDFPEYLALLRREGMITYYEAGLPVYAVLCKRAEEDLSFSIPAGCAWEGSMDNTGFAVIAVTFPKEVE